MLIYEIGTRLTRVSDQDMKSFAMILHIIFVYLNFKSSLYVKFWYPFEYNTQTESVPVLQRLVVLIFIIPKTL